MGWGARQYVDLEKYSGTVNHFLDLWMKRSPMKLQIIALILEDRIVIHSLKGFNPFRVGILLWASGQWGRRKLKHKMKL